MVQEFGRFDDAILFAGFMRFLDAPERGPTNAAVSDGSNLRNGMGCNRSGLRIRRR
jgi:hypothetical protein